MSDFRALVCEAALYRDGPFYPVLLKILAARLVKCQAELAKADEPRDLYRQQGAIRELVNLQKDLTISLAQP